MTNELIIISAVFGGKAHDDGEEASTYSADVAFAIFCFFLWLLYGLLSLMLFFYRDQLNKREALPPDEIDIPEEGQESATDAEPMVTPVVANADAAM